MDDAACVEFLQWALPRLRLRWEGFRRVRRQVCRRVRRRVAELGLPDLAAYRNRLEVEPREWQVLDRCCRVTISRFFRDRGVFERLATDVLPAAARSVTRRGDHVLRLWSAGCASGEEPYSLVLVWTLALAPAFPGVDLKVVATEVDPALLRRARQRLYPASALRDVSATWRQQAFRREGECYRLRGGFARRVSFQSQDIRSQCPPGSFDGILCRNLVFTYFTADLQQRVAERLIQRLRSHGFLMLGAHESLPGDSGSSMAPWQGAAGVFRRVR